MVYIVGFFLLDMYLHYCKRLIFDLWKISSIKVSQQKQHLCKIKERRRQDVCDDEQGVQQQAGYLTETRKY